MRPAHRIARDDDGFGTNLLAVLMFFLPVLACTGCHRCTVLRAPHFVSQLIVIFQEESHGDTLLSNLV